MILHRLPWLLIGLGLLPGAWLMWTTDLIGDELAHGNQIAELMQGHFTQTAGLTTTFAYHLVVAGPARLLGIESLFGLRLVSTMVSSLAALAFYLVASRLTPRDAALRTAQFFFLPLAHPFFFVLYTDLFALTWLLLALWAVLAERPRLAGVFAILAMVVRQNNVVWLGFFALLLLPLPERLPPTWEEVRAALGRLWVLGLGGVAFVVFLLVNGGVALGDHEAHPVGALRWENPLCSVVAFGALFAPLLLAKTRAALAELRARPWWLALPVLAGLIYLFVFEPSHRYNFIPGFLFNDVARAMAGGFGVRLLWLLPIAATLLLLLGQELLERRFYLLHVFWLLSLLPAALVSPRYFIPVFACFLLVRRSADRRVEWLLLALFVLLDAWLLPAIWQRQLFL